MKEKIIEYVKELEKRENARLTADFLRLHPTAAPGSFDWFLYDFGIDEGKKYFKVWRQNKKDKLSSRSVFCFIDNDGNIYKPAGWARPAPGVRATLAAPVYTSRELYR